MKLIAKKTFRTGVQSLWYDETKDQYYVKIVNRTYRSVVPIPEAKAGIWKLLLM